MRSQRTPAPTDFRRDGNNKRGDLRTIGSANTSIPATQLLSNGRYHVMVTNSGSGYSQWKDIALTRWQEDCTRDNWGSFFYIRDLASNDFWSATCQPTLESAAKYQVHFSGDLATMDSDAFGLATRTEIAVATDDVELHRITISNHGASNRSLDVTSYTEVVLDTRAADDAHPAFSKLFVQTEIIESAQAIVCHRRSGASAQKKPWMFHIVLAGAAEIDDISYETDRAHFIGRGHTTADPQAMLDVKPLSGAQGSVLDPIMSIRCPISIGAGRSVTITYLFGVGESRDACLALISKYHRPAMVERGFKQASVRFEQSLNDLGLTREAADLYARLADSIVYSGSALRADPAVIAQNRQGQSGLWGLSVSGDLPIVLLELNETAGQGMVSELVRAHAYWRTHGLAVDLVICGAAGATSSDALQEQVVELVKGASHKDMIGQPGGVFVHLQAALAPADRILFQAVARIVLSDSAGTLAEQLASRDASSASAQGTAPVSPAHARSPGDEVSQAVAALPRLGPSFNNGIGGFSRDGREYIITLEQGQTTPTPWVNILANPLFGTLVSESGCANTWSENAHEFLLSPWSNDPVGDSVGEAFYLRDEDTGRFWSPTPWPCRSIGQYVCRHGFGYSIFTCEQEDISSEMQVYVALDAPIKFMVLKIRNQSSHRRHLSATGYVEWVLGDLRTKTMAHVVTRVDSDTGALVASNPYSMDFGDRLAFFTIDDAKHSMTGDRTEFLGRNGSVGSPAAMARGELGGKVGAALDPCAAIRVPFDLAGGEEREVVFKLGASQSNDQMRTLIKRFSGLPAAHEALVQVTNYWSHTLSAVQIDTPDEAINILGNGWLVYQIMSSRLWGRTAFYQSSGAFGFRDQLQDVMALVHTEPGLVRSHLLLCASRQYPEGDVQHWWHPPVGRGIRSRCSDDYLWLPLALCRYVVTTGDVGVLDEPVHFLQGRALNSDEASYYELPGESVELAPLYEHCVRAIKNGLRFGVHGLPLMGTGDWNDGMDKVGAQGLGESIWLGFFLYDALTQFSQVAKIRGDAQFAAHCKKEAAQLGRSLEQHGWDGAWFRRAYFDDGSILGSAKNAECQIDSIAQSWSVLSGAATKKHARMAMQAVDRHLVASKDAVIKLLAPPFETSEPDPGYIQAYVPGVRENGGQYTHAAVWSVMAFAALHDNQRTWELLSMLNPISHTSTPDSVALYKVEPYVVASDVYSLAPHTGRGGWTWYSGSAGWLYRLILESVLGLRREADNLYVEPCVPAHWESYKISYRFGVSTYSIWVRQDTQSQLVAKAEGQLLVDGVAQRTAAIKLVDDERDHQVQVVVHRA